MNTMHTFTIDHLSDDDGKRYTGQFTCKKLSIMDQSRIQVRKAQLSGGLFCVRDDTGIPTGKGLDEEAEFLNLMIAELDTLLVQKPQWWDLDQITDQDLMLAVYKEVSSYENSFRRSNNAQNTDSERSDHSSKNGSSPEHPQAVAGNNPTKVVGEEVQAALDA